MSAAKHFPELDRITETLEQTLQDLQLSHFLPDHITFSGNGEPTLHPEFPDILRQTAEIRNRLAPTSRIAVLTNGTTLDQPSITEALQWVDRRIIKLDAGSDRLFHLINQPQSGISLQRILDALRTCPWNFEIQTLLLRGYYQDQKIDNTQPEEVHLWLSHLQSIQPRSVMLYSLERQAPAPALEPVSKTEMEAIAERVRQLSIPCFVY